MYNLDWPWCAISEGDAAGIISHVILIITDYAF